MGATLIVSKGSRDIVIDDEAMNGSAISSVIDVRGVNRIKIQAALTRVAYTAWAITVEECHDTGFAAGDTFEVYEIQAGGSASAATVAQTTSESKRPSFGVDVSLYDFVRITITGTDAGASDKASAWVTGVNV